MIKLTSIAQALSLKGTIPELAVIRAIQFMSDGYSPEEHGHIIVIQEGDDISKVSEIGPNGLCDEYDLPTRPPKEGDKQNKRHGLTRTVEIEALPVADLRAMCNEKLESHVHPDHLERIRLVEHNLLSGQSADFSVTAGEIHDTRTYIRGSIADMLSMLVDVENNIPKPEEDFGKIEDERIRNRCNFRKVCD